VYESRTVTRYHASTGTGDGCNLHLFGVQLDAVQRCEQGNERDGSPSHDLLLALIERNFDPVVEYIERSAPAFTWVTDGEHGLSKPCSICKNENDPDTEAFHVILVDKEKGTRREFEMQ
jgi:hypothetical protein